MTYLPIDVVDPKCGRKPEDIIEYVILSERGAWESPSHYVWWNVESLDKNTGHFTCEDCT